MERQIFGDPGCSDCQIERGLQLASLGVWHNGKFARFAKFGGGTTPPDVLGPQDVIFFISAFVHKLFFAK